MIRFCTIDKGGQIIFSNLNLNLKKLAESCPTLLSVLVPGQPQFRNGKIIDQEGSTYLITDEGNLVNNEKAFRSRILMLHSILKDIGKLKEKILQDALHDIQTIQAHNSQEIYQLIPYQDFISKEHNELIDNIQDIILENPKDAAYALLHILHNSQAINTQLTILRLDYGLSFPLQIREQDIKKTFLSVYHKFVSDFSKNNINCVIGDNSFFGEIDYETFRAGLIPLLENMVKYISRNTELNIEFIDSKVIKKIKFDMISVKLEPGEELKIFTKNYSGENAKKFKINGKGLGMHNAQRLLEQSNLKIKVIRGDEEKFVYDHIPYHKNILEIIFL